MRRRMSCRVDVRTTIIGNEISEKIALSKWCEPTGEGNPFFDLRCRILQAFDASTEQIVDLFRHVVR